MTVTKTYTPADVAKIVADRFDDTGPTPRSAPYQLGFKNALLARLCNQPWALSGYTVGTAEADAFFAGCDEGKAKARQLDAQGAA